MKEQEIVLNESFKVLQAIDKNIISNWLIYCFCNYVRHEHQKQCMWSTKKWPNKFAERKSNLPKHPQATFQSNSFHSDFFWKT